jgi:hypothetical protein
MPGRTTSSAPDTDRSGVSRNVAGLSFHVMLLRGFIIRYRNHHHRCRWCLVARVSQQSHCDFLGILCHRRAHDRQRPESVESMNMTANPVVALCQALHATGGRRIALDCGDLWPCRMARALLAFRQREPSPGQIA